MSQADQIRQAVGQIQAACATLLGVATSLDGAPATARPAPVVIVPATAPLAPAIGGEAVNVVDINTSRLQPNQSARAIGSPTIAFRFLVGGDWQGVNIQVGEYPAPDDRLITVSQTAGDFDQSKPGWWREGQSMATFTFPVSLLTPGVWYANVKSLSGTDSTVFCDVKRL